MTKKTVALFFFTAVLNAPATAMAQTVYLYEANMTVSLGPTMAPEPFANRTTAESLANVINLDSPDASEFHSQLSHVWVSGGGLELVFDFGVEYYLETLHFWNYHGEFYDVDDIDLTFLDSQQSVVGSVSDISPALGNDTGFDSTPIFAEDFALGVSAGVRFVHATLSGTTNQVDFNNMGFTGTLVPEPATGVLLLVCGCLPLLPRRSEFLPGC